jgi:hypothetical protein
VRWVNLERKKRGQLVRKSRKYIFYLIISMTISFKTSFKRQNNKRCLLFDPYPFPLVFVYAYAAMFQAGTRAIPASARQADSMPWREATSLLCCATRAEIERSRPPKPTPTKHSREPLGDCARHTFLLLLVLAKENLYFLKAALFPFSFFILLHFPSHPHNPPLSYILPLSRT